jgi:quercetin dioxygenase-like cupin family protein
MKNTVESLIPFHLRTAILESGRSHTYLAETENLSVVIKCYASGGENALHAHPNEDHVFVVLQGEATYHDSEAKTLVLIHNPDGIAIPARSAANNYEAPVPVPGSFYE